MCYLGYNACYMKIEGANIEYSASDEYQSKRSSNVEVRWRVIGHDKQTMMSVWYEMP